MSWFTRSRCRQPKFRVACKGLPRALLAVEILEYRVMPSVSTRFVVPPSQPIDNSTTFHDLQTALSTAGLVADAGTVIIEQNSVPGTLSSLPSLTNLTIQGDPNFGLMATPLLNGTPAFTISSGLTISSAQQGITFKGVAINLTGSGNLTFNGNGTITGCNVVDVSSTAIDAMIFAGATDVLTNSTISNAVTVNDAVVDVKTPASGSSNVIAGDRFVSTAFIHPISRTATARAPTSPTRWRATHAWLIRAAASSCTYRRRLPA